MLEVDGHDFESLYKTFVSIPRETGKPHLIIANTIKGKGISFIEGRVEWHHKVPSDEEYRKAIEELEEQLKTLEEGDMV